MDISDNSAVLKEFIKRYLPVAVLIMMLSGWFIYNQKQHYTHLVKNHEVDLVKRSYLTISAWLESGIEDVSFISGLVERVMTGPGAINQKYDELANIFSVFGRERRTCVQVRYLSPAGQELVRINMEGGTSMRVGSEFLQNKGTRTYLQDAKELNDGVFVSAFSLNKEFGKVEIPYVPVIRFSKKVFSPDGEEIGFVIINLSGINILDVLKEVSEESFGAIYFVNNRGGWIIGPDKKYDWRFLFGTDDCLVQDRFPNEWNKITEGISGQFYDPSGLYTFTTIGEKSFPAAFPFQIVFKEGWKVISKVSYDEMGRMWSWGAFFLLTALLTFSGVVFWKKTRSSIEGELISKALKQSEQRFMDVTNAAGEFIWETGPDGCFVFVTGRAEDILGYSSEELIGRSPFDFVDEESSWEVRKEFLDAAQGGRNFNGLVFKFVNRDGRKLWLEFNGVPVFDESGTVTGFRGATSDITAQKKALQDLQDREDMLQSISDSVQDALVLMDENGLVHFWNPAAEAIFGYSATEMLGERLQNCIHAEDNEQEIDSGAEDGDVGELFGKYGAFTVNVRRKGGAVFPAEVLLSPLRKDEKWWVVGTIRDVTERKEAEDKLRKLATTDPLTGLSNRRFFMESAEDALARSLRYDRELSLLMMDIDYFKTVNDMYGHDAGDDVLKGLSATGLRILRNIDVFGRIGGEEFSILLPDTGLEGAKMVAERLRNEIEKAKIVTRAGELGITVSIGVAVLNEKTRTLEHLLKAADIGLYAAKRAGRNQVAVQLSPEGSVEN